MRDKIVSFVRGDMWRCSFVITVRSALTTIYYFIKAAGHEGRRSMNGPLLQSDGGSIHLNSPIDEALRPNLARR